MMKIGLENKSYWEVNQLVNTDELFPGKARMIQALKELSVIAEGSIPEEVMKELKYSDNLAVFFPRFLKLFESLRTPIRGFEIKFDGHYYINANCYYDYNSQTFYAMPLSFLPELKKRNKVLHNMIVEAVKILSDKCVPVIDNPCNDDDDYLIENLVEYCTVQKNDVSNKDQQMGIHEMNLFYKYKENYINKILIGPGDRLWLIGQIAKYKPKIKVEQMAIDWLNEVLDAANEPNNLKQFNENAKCEWAKMNDIDYEDIYNDAQPVEIFQIMRFVWFGCDGYMKSQVEQLGEYGGNFGEIEFCNSYECRNPKDLENSRQNFITDWGLFPEKLTSVMTHGNDLAWEIWGYINNKVITILDNGKI